MTLVCHSKLRIDDVALDLMQPGRVGKYKGQGGNWRLLRTIFDSQTFGIQRFIKYNVFKPMGYFYE